MSVFERLTKYTKVKYVAVLVLMSLEYIRWHLWVRASLLPCSCWSWPASLGIPSFRLSEGDGAELKIGPHNLEWTFLTSHLINKLWVCPLKGIIPFYCTCDTWGRDLSLYKMSSMLALQSPAVIICTASGHYMYHQFQIQQFYVLPTHFSHSSPAHSSTKLTAVFLLK